MATPSELKELEHGDGAWENIQEVLRFGFRDLWGVFFSMDSRIAELENAVATQKSDSSRQQQHLEAIAQTLNAMSEQLRVETTEQQQLEARLEYLERELQDQLTNDRTAAANDNAEDSIDKISRRLSLLEEEMGHVTSAIDRKADIEAVLTQEKNLQEILRARCKKTAFDRKIQELQQQLLTQRELLENQLQASMTDFEVVQEALVRSEMKSWGARNLESVTQSAKFMIDDAIQQQSGLLGELDVQVKRCCDGLQAQHHRLSDIQGEAEGRIRVMVAADREEIAQQCSEAHGRIDYQFRTQEESFKRVQKELLSLREEIVVLRSSSSNQMTTEISAAVEALDRRALDREQQDLEAVHRRLTEETQLTIANALHAVEHAKDKEQRKWKQQQLIVGRKMAELDQTLQLIGRQLIQNTSQLQVMRNEQLVHDMDLDVQGSEENCGDQNLLASYENTIRNDILAEGSQSLLPHQSKLVKSVEAREVVSAADTEAIQALRSQHHVLQEQLDRTLRNYSEVLAKENNENSSQATKQSLSKQ
ncbi:hypothetical protein PHYBOEH_006045 [Phytophthora boehmeriae]|uniref:Uncharacterized protein n=1 Tax=Phytophthora boehmeriae TaxID=109152 RepID=A0A8T1WNV0_9STRA|nr:hypothetical protein PHYBOEH_006045 [Phytophthora boehmeriae]